MALVKDRDVITDEIWAVIEPLLPAVLGRSRPWLDHRMVVEGVAWRFRTGSPWRDLPERFGPGNTVSSGLTGGRRTGPGRRF
jgi:transposase